MPPRWSRRALSPASASAPSLRWSTRISASSCRRAIAGAIRHWPIRSDFSACRRSVFSRACSCRSSRGASRAGAGCSLPDRSAVGAYGSGTLVPRVLASTGFSVVSSLTYTSILFLGYPLGSALSLPIVERIDRRWLIVWSAVLMAVFGLGLGSAASPGAIIAFGFAYTVVSNVFSNAFHIFQAEIFPTFVRATAAGTSYGLSRLSSAGMPFILLPVLDRFGAAAMFAVVAVAMLIVVIDVVLFAPRTTGRALAIGLHPMISWRLRPGARAPMVAGYIVAGYAVVLGVLLLF